MLTKLNPLICTNPYGSLWLWCHVPDDSYIALCQKLTQKDIIIAPGELFSTTPLSGYFRLSISDLSLEAIDELVSTLKQYLLPSNSVLEPF